MFRNVIPADSILRYREGDFNETVYIKGDEKRWTEYINLCREYREDSSIPSLKELQNEEIVNDLKMLFRRFQKCRRFYLQEVQEIHADLLCTDRRQDGSGYEWHFDKKMRISAKKSWMSLT